MRAVGARSANAWPASIRATQPPQRTDGRVETARDTCVLASANPLLSAAQTGRKHAFTIHILSTLKVCVCSVLHIARLLPLVAFRARGVLFCVAVLLFMLVALHLLRAIHEWCACDGLVPRTRIHRERQAPFSFIRTFARTAYWMKSENALIYSRSTDRRCLWTWIGLHKYPNRDATEIGQPCKVKRLRTYIKLSVGICGTHVKRVIVETTRCKASLFTVWST